VEAHARAMAIARDAETIIKDRSRWMTGWGRPSLLDDLQPRLLYFGCTVIDTPWIGSPGGDPYFRIYTNREAGATVRCGGLTVALNPGAVVVVPAWTPWIGHCPHVIRHVNAHVAIAQWSAQQVRRWFPRPIVISNAAPAAEWIAIADALLEASPRASQALQVHALIARSLAAACALLPEDADAILLDGGDRPLAVLQSYIENRLTDDLGNEALARMLGVSEPTLVRWCRRHLGGSPGRYVTERRCARAAELLAHSDQAIEMIAGEVGYADRSAFTRAFRRLFAATPAAYRLAHSGSSEHAPR
jgi:AraC-like DNA-binding protein